MENKETTHQIIIGAAQNMKEIENNSVALVVTSPPYPMIEMWDNIMSNQNKEIGKAIESGNGLFAYELMHQELDKVWSEVERVLIPGGFACINIGDATRTIGGDFRLYPNHSRIIEAFQKLNIPNLPNIIWRKQTNAPNKFMGSGMLPSGAYVTLEHEWVLIFRKGGKREFKKETEKEQRRNSSFFWEERNIWFSDLWDIKGTKQKIDKSESRIRSAAYPFELPYRLINMYSVKGDTILDPFLGTGTTTLAAITSERNSIGYEIDKTFLNLINENIKNTSIENLNDVTKNRIKKHMNFIENREDLQKKEPIKHFNDNLKLKVITSQEKDISFSEITSIKFKDNSKIITEYKNIKTV